MFQCFLLVAKKIKKNKKIEELLKMKEKDFSIETQKPIATSGQL